MAMGNDRYPRGSLYIGSDRQQNASGSKHDLLVAHSIELPFQYEPAPSVTEITTCCPRGVAECFDRFM